MQPDITNIQEIRDLGRMLALYGDKPQTLEAALKVIVAYQGALTKLQNELVEATLALEKRRGHELICSFFQTDGSSCDCGFYETEEVLNQIKARSNTDEINQ